MAEKFLEKEKKQQNQTPKNSWLVSITNWANF